MRMLEQILLTACCALSGCAHFDVELANFMAPDRGTRTARLPAGYVIENRIIASGGRSIGLTYARHPNSQATIFFCGGDAFHRSIGGKVLLLASRADEMMPAKLAFEMQARLLQAHRDVRLVEFPHRAHGAIVRSPAFSATRRNFLEHVRPLP